MPGGGQHNYFVRLPSMVDAHTKPPIRAGFGNSVAINRDAQNGLLWLGPAEAIVFRSSLESKCPRSVGISLLLS